MASTSTQDNGAQLLLVGDASGVTVIETSTPLRRLNYFDGKFLRADDFDVEQRYLRQLVALSNQGLGAGVVYGYDTSLGKGDTVQIDPGLAIDSSGKVLLLQSTVTESIQALIDASQAKRVTLSKGASAAGGAAFSDCVEAAAPPPATVLAISDVYVIAICAAEALCGQSDVYGKLCEEACVTSTDRPYRLDGIVLRAIPLQLSTPFPTSKAVNIGADLYLRSKVAHSWFADEVRRHPDAVSRAGLLSDVWCAGASYAAACCEVPLAVVARAGSTTVFLDAWIVRRERIEAPARRYWQWRMRMRPCDVFLAQILQFQCQLADLLSGIQAPGSRQSDPCAPQYKVLGDAAQLIDQVRSGLVAYRDLPALDSAPSGQPPLLTLSMSQITDLRDRLQVVLNTAKAPARPTDRILIRGGIIEMPSAGYLPVVTGSQVTVNDQVRALLGEGLDLRFCITTADYVAHAVEERQHMDRISLVEGLDNPDDKPHVDILVPDGKATVATAPAADVYDASIRFSTRQTGGLVYEGAAREEALASGGSALCLACAGLSEEVVAKLATMARGFASPKAKPLTFTGDVGSNAFVNQPKATPARFDSLLNMAGSNAAAYTDAVRMNRLDSLDETAIVRLPTAYGTVDGLWLTARAEKAIETLTIGQQTAAALRIVLGMHPQSPEAVELSFHGTVTIARVETAPAGPVLFGTLNGIYAVGLLKENQGQQKTTEYLVTERGNWPVRFAYTGDGANGSVALVLELPGNTSAVRIAKTTGGGGSRIGYEIAFVEGTWAAPVVAGRIDLVADADVVNAANRFHRAAEAGLGLVQAALIVSEPGIKATAEGDLFPAQPGGATELTIQAVRDWVAFVRRREKTCAVETPVVVQPPRRYRVVNITARNPDEAQKYVSDFESNRKNADPTKLVNWINALLKEQSDRTPLVVTFDGGAATAKTDPAAIETDWRTFQAGRAIYYAAAGAVGEADAALQLARVKTVEGAIIADSREDASAQESAIVPYPEGALPADADGIMLFITIAPAEAQRVFAVNPGFMDKIVSAVGLSEADLAAMLGMQENADLGPATFTVDAGGSLSVDDAAVLANFKSKVSSKAVRRGFVILQSGASSGDSANRVSVGGTITHAITPGAKVDSATFAGTWPAALPPSVLLLMVAKV